MNECMRNNINAFIAQTGFVNYFISVQIQMKMKIKCRYSTRHDIFKNSKPRDNQVTFLPKYSSTKASATLLAKRTSPAFVFVHEKRCTCLSGGVFGQESHLIVSGF